MLWLNQFNLDLAQVGLFFILVQVEMWQNSINKCTGTKVGTASTLGSVSAEYTTRKMVITVFIIVIPFTFF